MDFAVDPDVAQALAGEDACSGPALRRDFEATIRDLNRCQLAGRPGYFVLSGLGQLSEPESRAFVLSVAGMLGDLMPQDFQHELVREVADRGSGLASGPSVRYSETRQGGSLHSDGCHHPQVPDLFTLHCIRQARSGGSLLLVHVDDLIEELSTEPDVLDALRQQVHFDCRAGHADGVAQTVRRPVLDTSEGTARIYYMRDYIDSAHRRAEVPPLSAEQVKAFDVLDALLDGPSLQRERRLRPGEMIVVNNRSVLHGRTAFPAETGPGRLLLRTWIAAFNGRPAAGIGLSDQVKQ
ncbi:MAG: TauD/TfdA family dioxygenase [Actinomycetota bacterium]|nr:TauD/TfdA family dioxygenase [Actinomycetota bacterium]MDQ2956321.1 TauD/TfdA family dioxygenase [Actinomycetota bacterium]